MFASPPKLVLRRTVMIRILLCFLVLPFGLLSAWGALVAFADKPPDPIFGGICAALAVLILGTFAFLFRRESRRVVRIHEEGIAQELGSRTLELRWLDILEVRFEAIRVQAGGLIGAAVGAAANAATKNKGGALNANTTNITVRLIGADQSRITLNSNDKGVVAAFEEILSQVNPRLLAEAVQTVQKGRSAQFGPIAVSSTGIAAGRKQPIPFGDIESLVVKSGNLRLKKRGSWLDAFSIPIKRIPNVFVLTDLYHHLSATGGTTTGVGSNLARTTFV